MNILNLIHRRILILASTCFCFCFLTEDGQAAPPKHISIEPSRSFLTKGGLQGGRAIADTSIINIKIKRSKKNQDLEALFFTFGDRNLKPRSGPLSYFKATLDPSGQQLIIDFADLNLLGFVPVEVEKQIKASRIIKNHRWLYDPVAPSTQMILDFKRPIEFRAQQKIAQNKPSELIFEFQSVKKK